MHEKALINFSAGPSKLPNVVKQRMLEEFLNYDNTGSNIFELSHRSSNFVNIVKRVKACIQDLFSFNNSHEVLLMQGGATGQFAAIPLNIASYREASLNGHGNVASNHEKNFIDTSPDYFITGQWSAKAAKEAQNILGTNVNLIYEKDVRNAFVNGDDEKSYNTCLEQYLLQRVNPHASYFYYCSNETIDGIEINDGPTHGDQKNEENFLDMIQRIYKTKWNYKNDVHHQTNGEKYEPRIICDMSSNFCTKAVDVSRFDLIYASAQKNIGIAGITVVLIKKDLLLNLGSQTVCPIPSVLNYKTVAKADSLPNTPPVYSIYALDVTLQWIKDHPFDTESSDLNNGHGLSNGSSHNIGPDVDESKAVLPSLAYWERLSHQKSRMIYDVIDSSNGFYTLFHTDLNNKIMQNTATNENGTHICRSRINIPFNVNPGALEPEFLERAKNEENMLYLKGHRSVGGIRVSLFNSITMDETRRLAEFMKRFYLENNV